MGRLRLALYFFLKGSDLRDFLNGILSFIGATSLTDLEFSALTIDSSGYNAPTYTALSDVLKAREAVSTIQDKLYFYFRARGVEIAQASTGKSNIFLGAAL